MRLTRVVGASLFAVHYGASFITALLVPAPGHDDAYEDAARFLMIPVVGPFIAAPTFDGFTLGFGLAQTAGVITYALGLILDDSSDSDPPGRGLSVTVDPLAGGGGAAIGAKLRF